MVADVEALHGRGHRGRHLGVAVTQVVGAAVEVDVDEPLALDVVDEVALPAVDDQRNPGVDPELGLVRVPELLGFRQHVLLRGERDQFLGHRDLRHRLPPGESHCCNRMARSAKPKKYRSDRLLSRGCVSLRLTQPELLIRFPQAVTLPANAPEVYHGSAPGPEVPRLPVRPPVEDFDVSQRTDVAKLRKGAIGLGGVLFLTVTGSAPISAMLFNTPIVVGFGQGVGAPAAFMFATIVLVVFSVGYVAMARKKTTAGGFYSYISHGLGRELGIGTGYASVVAYSVFEASLAGGFAYFLSLKLNQFGVQHRLALAGPGHGADHQHPDLLRRPDLQHGARGRADQRGRHPAHLRRLPARPRARDRGPAQPRERLQELPGGGQARGRRDRHRPVLRLLVLGRLRDGAELRRGIPRPQADRPPRPVHLGDRARRLLHDHVLGLARRVSRPPRRRSPSRRPTRPSTTSPRPATTPGSGWPR